MCSYIVTFGLLPSTYCGIFILQAPACQNNTLQDIIKQDPDLYLMSQWAQNIGAEIFFNNPDIFVTTFSATNEAIQQAVAEYGKNYDILEFMNRVLGPMTGWLPYELLFLSF